MERKNKQQNNPYKAFCATQIKEVKNSAGNLRQDPRTAASKISRQK